MKILISEKKKYHAKHAAQDTWIKADKSSFFPKKTQKIICSNRNFSYTALILQPRYAFANISL